MGFQSDWALVQAALPDLQEYILSKDLYWPLKLTAHTPGSIQTPQLTIGSLDLSMARLAAAGNAAELNEFAGRINQVRQEWRANWSRKAAREYTSRLNLWQQYLRELRSEPRQQAAFYANEVRQRAMLTLLVPELLDGVSQPESEQLNMLDGILRGLTQPGAFVWEPEAASAFPQDTFWFLYARPE
jgi:hypothetical protein